MIAADMTLSVRRIPLSCLQIIEYSSLSLEKVQHYTRLLQQYPGQDMDPMLVFPSKVHPGMYRVQEGRHRYLSYMLAGRACGLCVVVEDTGAGL